MSLCTFEDYWGMTEEEVYQEMLPIIRGTVSRFHTSHQMEDYEELCSVADMGFFIAYKKYDDLSCSFPTYVRKIVWYNLCDHLRKECKKNPRGLVCSLEDYKGPLPKRSYRPLIDILDGLSETALLALQTLENLSYNVEVQATSWFALRRELKTTLKENGWSVSQLNNTFKEIQEALVE